ncbi:E3 ubiquitin-protein ligase makorin [Senna tora]|uniref:E3 ubiquitin-protein ligase makorin n=1 Tax=Senna tora TaxID=362788 RepID=A0A834TQ29_9FABA|nr:E3 ubiquitin-protein ligase makorin [Senna tora]
MVVPVRICKFYARGSCLKGEQCDYSHDRKDTPVDICTFYQKGHCSYGSRCRYKHIKDSQAHLAVSSPSGPHSLASNSVMAHTTRGKSSWVPKTTKLSPPFDKRAGSAHCKHQDSPKNGDVGESSTAIPQRIFCSFAAANCPLGEKCLLIHGDQCLYCKKYCLHPTEQREREDHLNSCEKKEKYLQVLKDSQEIECNVCLERVLSKPKAAERKFGMLPECDHAFCLSCIRNWRSSAPTSGIDNIFNNNDNNNTVRTCPVCRTLSYFVIPSPIWYSSKEEKQEIIDNYKAKCKLIDCKHFNLGNGNCPFGNRCFYKHNVKPGSLTWRHGRPPPPRRHRTNNNMDMYDMIDMLSEFDLESGEFYSIMRDSEFFEDMDPFEAMAVSDALASGSGQRFFDDEDEDEDEDPEEDFFRLVALSAALGGNPFDFNPMGAAFFSMGMNSDLEEEDSDEE